MLLNGKRDPLLSTFSAFSAFVIFGFFVFETAAAFAPADDPELLDFAAPEIIYMENAGSQTLTNSTYQMSDDASN